MSGFLKKYKSSINLIIGLYAIAVLCVLLIPSGVYERVNGVIDANSFHFVDKPSPNILKMIIEIPLTAIKGFWPLFITQLTIGGTIGIIGKTGSIDIAIYSATEKYKDKALILIPIVLIIEGFLGTLGVLISTVVVFIPLGIMIARRLKIDNIFAVAIIFLGSYTTFMVSPVSPVSTAIAQNIAGIPVFSGFGFRSVLVIVFLTITCLYLMFYGYRVRKNPKNSVMKLEEINFEKVDDSYFKNNKMTLNQKLIIISFFVGFFVFAYGSVKLNFKTLQLAFCIAPTAVIASILGKFSPKEAVLTFWGGAKKMLSVIIIMVIAMGTTVILNSYSILDSVVYYLSKPLINLNSVAAAIAIFIVNSIINLFIPSGSTQAATVMPIMAKMSDIVGLSKQVIVLAFQMGDGFTNLLNPMNVMLIASLNLAGAKMKHWFKLVIPLYLIFFVVICISLTVAVLINWQ